MASLTVAAGERGVHATLVAATVDTVTFDRDCDRVEVLNATGTADIYFTTEGSTPAVAGKNCYRLPSAIGALRVEPDANGNTVVKLISAGTPSYSVTQA